MAKEKSSGQQDVATESKGQQVKLRTAAPAPALSPWEDLDRWLGTFLRHGWMRPFQGDWPLWHEWQTQLPRVDVVNRDTEIVVRAEVPGVDKDNLDVSLTGNTITIKGSTRHEEKEEKGDYYRAEMSRGSFTRTVTLPAEVDGAQAKATFKDGVLEVTLPKVEAAQRRPIKVE